MNILVIDDEPLVAKTLGRLLRPNTVQIIGSSLDAVETIVANDFDLIFCDLMMPGLTGQELYLLACEAKPGVGEKFIFITGGAVNRTSEEFLATSASRVLYKPFDLKTLRAFIGQA